MYDVHVIFDNRPGEQGEIAAALEQAIAAVAATMADPSRVKMLCALMDGRAWTATIAWRDTTWRRLSSR